MGAARKTTTARGLGWPHKRQTATLKRNHVDGTPCWWCGEPMFGDLTASRNWDGRRLSGDHRVPRALGGRVTDQLLHATCNEQRGDGHRDHLRPALTGQPLPTRKRAGADDRIGKRIMAWPLRRLAARAGRLHHPPAEILERHPHHATPCPSRFFLFPRAQKRVLATW